MPLDVTQVALDQLDARLRILLPEQYAGSSDPLEPVPMRSAGLKFDTGGRVAWDEIWGSFCDLAMAGGPPHKGRLLEPGDPDAIAAQPDEYDTATAEICRGIWMAAELPAYPDAPGWVRVECLSVTMAEWLGRAIVMENVSVRWSGQMLFLPAAPHFRLDKEIKNVVTVIAKTTHYWMGHVPRAQKALIADLLVRMAAESPLIEPRDGWRGVECGAASAAVWLMRALMVRNVLARREERTLFVPINHAIDADGGKVATALRHAQRLYAHRHQPIDP